MIIFFIYLWICWQLYKYSLIFAHLPRKNHTYFLKILPYIYGKLAYEIFCRLIYLEIKKKTWMIWIHRESYYYPYVQFSEILNTIFRLICYYQYHQVSPTYKILYNCFSNITRSYWINSTLTQSRCVTLLFLIYIFSFWAKFCAQIYYFGLSEKEIVYILW